ncbi:hypothetical protein DXG01_017068 [Tephrocybe rancida]|nr:hypothetical protein DXG01_017068 [Tephrocybe rancida]
MATVHATAKEVVYAAPSENWDDDFEFNPLSRKNTTTNDTMIYDKNAHRMSIASSDWDHDDNDDHNNHTTNNTTILEDRTNKCQLSPEWIEPGPSTPRRTNNHAENWDDDFEDSPTRKAFPSPPGKDKTSPSRLRRKQPQQPRPESWDDEFEAEQAARASHSDEELGSYADRDEEDRTVTARSRRAPAQFSSSPPPVPALPLPFLLPNSATGPSPFPRSPTSSVFSVPTARPPSSAFTVTSTTHLRPTSSRSSSALSGLPPSPPIHRERERRRLRKKSRPQGAAIELAVIRGESDGYDYREESEVEVRPVTPPPPVPQSTPATPSASGSGGGAGALLSRIGSVKKWGVRKKKGSTAPSELGNDDHNSHSTPRPHSQASVSSVQSSSGSSQAPNQHRPSLPPVPNPEKRSSTIGPGPSWFFRSTSSTYTRGSTSELDLPAQPRTPTKNRHPRTDETTPAKLLKRKSLGFVQLKRGLGVGGHGDDVEERGRENPKEKTGEKYGGLGLGHAGDTTREVSVPSDEKQALEEKEKDGSRSFMGSVRRMSLVGRHKRTKSGVSLHNAPGHLDIVGLGSGLRDDNITPTPENVAARTGNKAATSTPSKTPRPPPHSLLPPIELQPPSPPRVRPAAPGPDIGKQRVLESMLSPGISLSTIPSSASLPSPTPSASPSRRVHLPPLGSPQAASLGRSTIGPDPVVAIGPGGMRRSSLGDLKIPERISQAQVGLKKDMERVREFAAGVERLKELQTTYGKLAAEVQGILDQQHHQQQQQQLERQQQLEKQQTRSITPSFFANLPRPMSRNRSNTNPPPPSASTVSLAQSLALSPPPSSAPAAPPHHAYKQLASAYYTIRSKYRISWECAELLIELGSGSNAAERGPPTSVSVPAMPLSAVSKTGRERAITLGGEDSKPPTPTPGQGPSSSVSSPGVGMSAKAGWRASTGKHDLSQRQLVLLKEILNGGDGSGAEDASIPEELVGTVNREWRWGKDPMSSTVTLPSENSSLPGVEGVVEVAEKGKLKKKRRASRLGMTGLRDILRSLTRSQDHNTAPPPLPLVPMSTTSLSTTDNSSMESHRYPHRRVSPTQGRRRPQTSAGPGSESVRLGRPSSPYSPLSLHNGKASPRRPSLASIFRLGQKAKPTSPELPPELRGYNHYNQGQRSVSRQDSSTGEEEEDWDRMDDASEDVVIGRAPPDATVRGKKVAKPGRSPYLQDTYAPSLPSLPVRPMTPKRSASASQSSIWAEGTATNGNGPISTPPPPLLRTTRLSNVEEHAQPGDAPPQHNRPPPRASSRSSFYRPPPIKSGSVRSMPPQPVMSGLPDPTLAMTPENIRPLLENAKDVQTKLVECIAEVRALLGPYPHP